MFNLIIFAKLIKLIEIFELNNNKRTKVVMTLVLSCFVLEFTPYGETAAEKVGVHPILVWWRRRELNPCPKAFSRDFLRAQSFN